MDVKLAFLVISAFVWLYNTDIGSRNADEFSATACQKFPVTHKELYHFVTFSGTVDKWLNWMTAFSEADQKPLGIGKMYKAIIRNLKILFQITDYIDGHLIVLESNDFVFRPRVEMKFLEENKSRNFTDCTCRINDSSKLIIKLNFQRNSMLFQHTLGVVFRAIFEHLLKESLQNLHSVLSESSICPNNVY